MTIPKPTVSFLDLLFQSVYFFYFSSCYSVFLTHFWLWMSWVFLFNLQICNATVSSVYIHFQVRLQNCEKQLFVSSCLSVRPRGTTQLPLNRIPWNLIFSIFWKSVQKIPVWLIYEKNNGYFTRRCTYMYDIVLNYSQNGNILDKICGENWNTRFMFIISFWKSCCLWDNVEKYCTVGQATDNNIIQCMHLVCWIRIKTHSNYVILLSHCNNSFVNAPQCYIYMYIAWIVFLHSNDCKYYTFSAYM